MFLEKTLQQIFGLSEKEANLASHLFIKKVYPKGAQLQLEGEESRNLFLVQAGIVREYYLHNGNEITKWLSQSPSIIVDIASFINQQSSRYSLQTLQHTELYSISFDAYQELKVLLPNWQAIEAKLISKCFAIIEERLMEFLTESAEQRYLAFFERQRGLFNEVPQQYIASMLGMSPETLSRLRAKQIS